MGLGFRVGRRGKAKAYHARGVEVECRSDVGTVFWGVTESSEIKPIVSMLQASLKSAEGVGTLLKTLLLKRNVYPHMGFIASFGGGKSSTL